MGSCVAMAAHADWIPLGGIANESRSAVQYASAHSATAYSMEKARSKLLFGDDLGGKAWPGPSYMQPQVNTSAKLNNDASVRVSTAGIEVPPSMAAGPPVSHLSARIAERMEERKQDAQRQQERAARVTPYLYKERDILLSHEANRQENIRLRNLHNALPYTRSVRDAFLLKSQGDGCPAEARDNPSDAWRMR